MRCSLLCAWPTPLADLQPELEAVQASGRRGSGGHGAQAAAAHLAVPAGKRLAVPVAVLLLPCKAGACTAFPSGPCEHTRWSFLQHIAIQTLLSVCILAGHGRGDGCRCGPPGLAAGAGRVGAAVCLVSDSLELLGSQLWPRCARPGRTGAAVCLVSQRRQGVQHGLELGSWRAHLHDWPPWLHMHPATSAWSIGPPLHQSTLHAQLALPQAVWR